MLYYLIVGIYVLVCLSLIGSILLQQGKGGDIANAFGGGGSQAAFGARAGATAPDAGDVDSGGAVRGAVAGPDDLGPAWPGFGGRRRGRTGAASGRGASGAHSGTGDDDPGSGRSGSRTGTARDDHASADQRSEAAAGVSYRQGKTAEGRQAERQASA